MPVYEQHTVLEIARGVRAFLKLRLGLVRGRTAGRSDSSRSGVKPENVVWIFGSGRSGSTWLRSMMSEMDRHTIWEEPQIGLLFGGFYDRAQKGQIGSQNFIMGEPTRSGWIQSIRNFVLDGAGYAKPNLGPDDYLVVKEPNGSMGAPLLAEALPESRMICLIRDPRDVVASVLDAAKEGGWMFERVEGAGWKEQSLAEKQPEVFVEQRARAYMIQAGGAKSAYEAHAGPKVLVKYEDLRSDTLPEMERIYRELGIPFERAELGRAVEKHAWENIPAEKKGEGKFYRKGTFGGWREDLTPEQVGIVEGIAGPILTEFYADQKSAP